MYSIRIHIKQIKWLVWAGVAAAILLVIATVTISVLVPNYLESELIPRAAQKYGLDARQVQIRRIGWFGADLGPIHLDGGSKPVIRIAAVHIDYSPFSLFRGKIKSIALGGVRVVLAVTPEGLSIPGLKLPRKEQSYKDSGNFPNLDALLPIGVGQIRLSQSEIVALWKGLPLSISIDMTLACDELHRGRLAGKADLSFLGSTIALAADLDQNANNATFTMESGHLFLGALAGFVDLPPGMAISASAKLEGRSNFQLTPFELKGLSLSAHLMGTNMALPPVVIQNLPTPNGDFKPITISLEATGPSAIKWHCGPFLTQAPLKTNVLDLKGEWAPGQTGRPLSAAAEILFPAQVTDAGITLPEGLPMTWQVQARQAAAGAIEFNAHTAGQAPLALEMTPFKIACPTYQININGRRLSGRPWHYRANLKMTKARISDTSHNIRLSGINIDMPLQWPPPTKDNTGTINVQNIQWNQHRLGDLKGRLQQIDRALQFSLRHRSKLFSKLNVLINGKIDADGGAVKANLPAYRFPEAIDLGRFSPNAAGILADGEIEADAELAINNGILSGSAALKAGRGSLRDKHRQLGLEGIHMSICLDDLMALKSAPRQKLRVDHLSLGKIVADDLEMEFQLGGSQTVFIEKARMRWCQGRINMSALWIAPGKEAYDVTLFCDRLNLAMVLEQLGAGRASGEGTVNGSIPLRWHKGRLSFDKGFLYSTPGKAGAIQLTGTEVLLAGLPPETPQHTQVDIATEALKDYTYKWAKLSVESQNENLLLKLQFDGKPNRLLPFAFDKQLGRFKRVEGQGQADFKGISIDLNFKSPLDKILHYKKLLTPKP